MAGYRLDLPFNFVYTTAASAQTGAKLTVYQNNTTTPVSLYSDRACTTPADNPMVSVSGYFPVRYVATPALHTLLLENTAGVDLLSANDIAPFQDSMQANSNNQASDATITALSNLSWTSGRPVIEFTAADAVSLTLTPSLTSLTLSGAATVGSIEWGGGTDATLTRSAAGRIAVEGVDVQLVGKKAIPIPASAMVANTTNGAAATTNETTTNKAMYRTLDFDTTTQESAQFLIPMPSSWNEGTVTFQACWTAASGSGGVAWDLAGLALSDDDALDTAFGTEQVVTDTLITAGDVHWTAESSAITIGGSPAANDLVIFRVRRVPANGSDTLAADAKLIAIRLFITTNDSIDA